MYDNLTKAIHFYHQYIERLKQSADEAMSDGVTLAEWMEKADDPSPDDHCQMRVAEALQGNTNSAESCLTEYFVAVKTGSEIHPAILEFLAFGVERLQAGHKGDVAFFLKPETGRPRDKTKTYRDWRHCFYVKKLIKKGLSVGDAVRRVATKSGSSVSAVTKAYQKWNVMSDDDFRTAIVHMADIERQVRESRQSLEEAEQHLLQALDEADTDEKTN